MITSNGLLPRKFPTEQDAEARSFGFEFLSNDAPELPVSRPIVERLRKVLLHGKSSRRHLPQSPLGQAMDYALGQWTTLEVYLQDGRVEIYNNLIENAIRPTAIGKKNWLFVGEAGAGQRGAILYTIVESCRRRKIDPYAYLREMLQRLPHMTNQQIVDVTPAAWAKAPKNSDPKRS